MNITSIDRFNAVFGPYGLSPNAVKPSYGMAEATLFVSTIGSDDRATAIYLDREELGLGRAVVVAPDAPNAVPQVSCGRVARSQWAVIVDPDSESELPDGRVGEIWLHGENVGRGYWGRERETDQSFRNKLQVRLDSGSHADGVAPNAMWFRTGDMGVYLGGELYITGRIKDLVIIDGRNHYPQDIEATVADASSAVRRGFVAAFSVPGPEGTGERLVVIAERGPGRARPTPSPSSRRSAPRCPVSTPCRWPTSCWSPPGRFRGPPAASWPAGPAARSTCRGCSARVSWPADRRTRPPCPRPAVQR